MDRAEKIGLGVAVAGHIVLFGLLSVGFLEPPEVEQPKQVPMEVSLAPDVALEATAPQPATQPAPSVAPEEGAPEDAAPPPEPAAEPAPEPEPAPPAPQPKPAPPQPAPPKPAPPKPAPAPAPKPAPVKPQPKPRRAEAPAKPAPKPAPAKPVAKPAPAAPARPAAKAPTAPARTAGKPAAAPAKPAAAKGAGSSATATTAKPRGSRLGNDFLKGLSDQPSPSKAVAAPAAKMGAQAMADIGSAIYRQVKPCADRQRNLGLGASRIRVTINLKLNRDGSLASPPRVVGHSGVDDENSRYVDRVDDLAIATFAGCAPLRGLPAELYDVQNGWSNFTLRYKLPG